MKGSPIKVTLVCDSVCVCVDRSHSVFIKAVSQGSILILLAGRVLLSTGLLCFVTSLLSHF